MLRSLLQGVSMGTGMGVGQELAGTLIQHVKTRAQQAQQGNATEIDIKCSGCGEVNTGDSKFCGNCGNSLAVRYNIQQGVKCACGYVNCQTQKFCSECGKGLAV